MKKFFAEFKAFAVKGNVIDLAVAVIIAGAFGKIVASFVNDLVMPLIAAVFGIPNFSELAVTVNGSEIMAGLFIQTLVDFAVVAFVIFIAVQQINRFKRKEADAPAPVPEPSPEEVLLQEIRDLLKENRQ
ncbi:large-conductance mechanosensitive channel protein MscL [Anoxynatronum buryatiense]|uniref:Large-conductance mechanosensitive channel n=1 Tax=Anoxynatronum buryatiense TaxID=489973 RepID=A0AA45WX39_9CLOT|nr:large-conductance mechanosensitive channel protein MscL [Anoxynatronum buryatiense]SMP62542.1 large conductance mechanosensitive channel [Anoxynatronum buryatiense]